MIERVEMRTISMGELLNPLDIVEKKVFKTLLGKLANGHDGNYMSVTALMTMFSDVLTESHSQELNMNMSLLVNRLQQPPFNKDRLVLKATLENIMGAWQMASDAQS